MADRPDLDRLESWQFDLPRELIAERPTAQREGARLLAFSLEDGDLGHRQVRELPELLQPGDLLVLNDTRVLPARLFGFRTQTGGKWEGLFLGSDAEGRWELIGETRGRLQAGESITVVRSSLYQDSVNPPSAPEAVSPSDTLLLTLQERLDGGGWLAVPSSEDEPESLLAEFGNLPLPPYLGRRHADSEDAVRYQTIFASRPGAIAAPTAGLHLTDSILDRCQQRGIGTVSVTLHVGIGTFRPVSTERLSEHTMHAEWCEVTPDAAAKILETKAAGGRVICVGTTSVRTLEAASQTGTIVPFCETTDLFIRPGYEFRTVDGLLTNFHLPGSTLLALVAALAGYDSLMAAYREAVARQYRFFSYGDAMLLT